VVGSHTLSDVAALRRIYRPPARVNVDKEIHHLDAHCRDFIAHSPFAVLGTTDGAGRVDTSPKGGPPGFATVLDDHRLAIPDMAGNNRIDSLRNIVRAGGVSLLFMIPGIGETMRVVGQASVSTEPDLLERCRVGTLEPNVAIVVEVTSAFIHCANSLRRSGMWQPERWPDTSDMASPARIFRDHMRLTETATTEEMQESLDSAYSKMTWAVGPFQSEGNEEQG
jgi:PPOX class probable FMN-dependent enzyme